jgi:hypothetical protein
MITPAPPETADIWDDRQRAARGTGTVFLTFLGPPDDEVHAAGYWDAHPEHPDDPPLARVVRHSWSDALAWAAERTGRIVVNTPTGGPYTAGAVHLPGRERLPDAFR